MTAIPLAIPDVVLSEPSVFGAARGIFCESFHQSAFETAECLYKTIDDYTPEHARSIAWNDSMLNRRCPMDVLQSLSVKDGQGRRLLAAEVVA